MLDLARLVLAAYLLAGVGVLAIIGVSALIHGGCAW